MAVLLRGRRSSSAIACIIIVTVAVLVQVSVSLCKLPRRLSHVDPGRRRMGPRSQGKVHADSLTVDLHARALIFGCSSVLRVLVIDKGEAPGTSRLCVIDQLQSVNYAEFGENLSHLGIRCVHAQAEYAQDTRRRRIHLQGIWTERSDDSRSVGLSAFLM